ncbi:MAG: hypothetical protein CSA79_02895 [Thiothrix nivea]|nr:MAG: hypothetical protein CSA79_02895 [Thiothrix nivea]
MRLLLGAWSSRWQHLLWRLELMLPMLLTQYSDEAEIYEERELSTWKLVLLSVIVLGLSGWSFFW